MGSPSFSSHYSARSLFEDGCNVQGVVIEKEVENLTLLSCPRECIVKAMDGLVIFSSGEAKNSHIKDNFSHGFSCQQWECASQENSKVFIQQLKPHKRINETDFDTELGRLPNGRLPTK